MQGIVLYSLKYGYSLYSTYICKYLESMYSLLTVDTLQNNICRFPGKKNGPVINFLNLSQHLFVMIWY